MDNRIWHKLNFTFTWIKQRILNYFIENYSLKSSLSLQSRFRSRLGKKKEIHLHLHAYFIALSAVAMKYLRIGKFVISELLGSAGDCSQQVLLILHCIGCDCRQWDNRIIRYQYLYQWTVTANLSSDLVHRWHTPASLRVHHHLKRIQVTTIRNGRADALRARHFWEKFASNVSKNLSPQCILREECWRWATAIHRQRRHWVVRLVRGLRPRSGSAGVAQIKAAIRLGIRRNLRLRRRRPILTGPTFEWLYRHRSRNLSPKTLIMM